MNGRRATALTSAVLIAAALAFGVPALLVPGAALAAALAWSWGYVLLVSHGSELQRTPQGVTAVEGERITLIARVSRGRLLRGGEIAARAGAPYRPRRWLERDELSITVTVGRRGRHEFGPSLLRVADPFGLVEAHVESAPTSILALPRIERVPLSLVRVLRTGSGAAGLRLSGAVGEVDGVRDALPGVAVSRVHWPTVARTGALVERVVEPEFDHGPLVVLDCREPVESSRLDAAVRAAGSLARAMASDGGARLLICDEPAAWQFDEALGAWPRIHARLATLGRGRVLAQHEIDRAPVVIWVSPAPVGARPAGVRRTPDFVVEPGAGGFASICGCGVRDSATRRSLR